MSRLVDRAYEKVELAGVYVDDGALLSGARCLREAADLLERANAKRNKALGVQK